jgi:hypothetical protein
MANTVAALIVFKELFARDESVAVFVAASFTGFRDVGGVAHEICGAGRNLTIQFARAKSTEEQS